MERTNLWPCPLDEKNLCTDWIEERFGESGFMETPDCKDGRYSYLAFVKSILIEVSWRFGSNQLTFSVIPRVKGSEKFLTEQLMRAFAEIKKIVGEVEECDNGGDSKIAVQYFEEKDRIDFFFFWK